MNQHTDEPRFVTITAEGVDYPIYLTSPDRDYIQKNLAMKGVPYELPMLTDMKARLRAESTILDIGANIGNHTFYLAQVLGCQVIAFEANDELAHAMDITTTEAGLEEKVTVHAFAVGEKPGFAAFEQAMPENLGGQSLQKGTGRIKVRTLDSFGISVPISAIKIDVEGMELDVLKGGRKIIESNLPLLYVEAQTKESFIQISSYLKTLGYCYRNTFNATPTHLFIHKEKLKDDDHMTLSALNRVEHEYDLLAANQKMKKDLVECQAKYREICQLHKNLKADNERLQKQEQLHQTSFDQSSISQLQNELDQAKQKEVNANQIIERLRDEIARERSEKEFQAQQFSQSNRADRADVVLQEKLTAEVERLSAKNRSQKALLDGQQALKSALEDSKKRCAEISFILENTQSEVAQLQAEKNKLLDALKVKGEEGAELQKLRVLLDEAQKKQQLLKAELEKRVAQVAAHDKENKELTLQLESRASQLETMEKQTAELAALKTQQQQNAAEISRVQAENQQLSSMVEVSQAETAKLEDVERALMECQTQLAQSQEDCRRFNAQAKDLSESLAMAQSDELKVRKLEQTIVELEEQRVDQVNAIESLKAEYEKYIEGLRVLQEQQQRDNEQQLHMLIQKKMESLAPLQANQEKLNKLIEYRNDIEKIYSERTPLLRELNSDQAVEKIQEKKTALDELNLQLAELNSKQIS